MGQETLTRFQCMEVEEHEGVFILTLNEGLNLDQRDDIEKVWQEFKAIFAKGTNKNLVVSLRNLKSVTRDFLIKLIFLDHDVRKSKGRLVFAYVRREIRQTFSDSPRSSRFHLSPNTVEALDTFEGLTTA